MNNVNLNAKESIDIIEKKLGMKDEGFFSAWGAKLMFSLISVKVWGLVGGTWVSTWLLVNNWIDNVHWITFNTTVWGLIFGMKEIFKISTGREKAEIVSAEKEFATRQQENWLRAKVALESQSGSLKKTAASGPKISPEGKEIVPEEPEVEERG
jgi:hypothetical protein